VLGCQGQDPREFLKHLNIISDNLPFSAAVSAVVDAKEEEESRKKL